MTADPFFPPGTAFTARSADDVAEPRRTFDDEVGRRVGRVGAGAGPAGPFAGDVAPTRDAASIG